MAYCYMCYGVICLCVCLLVMFMSPAKTAELVEMPFVSEDYHPSVLLHCWLGHLTCKIVSEMTYNVSSGTLNPTIPYHTVCVGELGWVDSRNHVLDGVQIPQWERTIFGGCLAH